MYHLQSRLHFTLQLWTFAMGLFVHFQSRSYYQFHTCYLQNFIVNFKHDFTLFNKWYHLMMNFVDFGRTSIYLYICQMNLSPN